MTSRERSARTKFYAVAAAAALASLALVGTVGLTRREADRRRRAERRFNGGPLRTVDSISELPEACGSYSYDFSYFYDDDATPPPTAQESSPVTPDEPLGLPEDSATAAPAAESDGALGRRLARAAAACALAALLI